jgi:chromate transporter
MISAFTFGGGYVIVPLMKKKFVDEMHWIDEEETLDFIAIAQSSPGAIAVNASILIGYRIAGLAGAAVTILGTVLPPMVILSIVSVFYEAFKESAVVGAVLHAMQAGVSAVIVSVVFSMGKSIVKQKDVISMIVMLAVFITVFFLKVNVIILIVACGVIGAIRGISVLKRSAE